MQFFITITRPKFVITLILLILLATFIGVLVPQAADKSPSYFETWKLTSPKTFYMVNILQLNRVYTSVWFLTLVFIILISLGYSIYFCIKRNLRDNWKIKGIIAEGKEDEVKGKETKCYVDAEKIKRVLKRKDYTELKAKENEFVFAKNLTSRWGSVIFHTGIFLIILSAFLTFSFQKRGFLQLIEGEEFIGKGADFQAKDLGAFVDEFNLSFKTRLLKFNPYYWDNGQVKEIESIMNLIKDGNLVRKNISVNKPIVFDGVTLYQALSFGYNLSLIIEKPTGEKLITNFLLEKPEKKGMPAVGNSDFPTTDYIFKMKFYPDVKGDSFYPVDPVLNLTLLKKGKIVYNGSLVPAAYVKLDEGILYIADIRNWGGFIFVKNECGVIFAYIGFALIVFGATVVFLFPYKKFHIIKSESGVKIYGAFRKEDLFDKNELDEIIADLTEKA